MEENRFERMARLTGQPIEKAQFKTYLRKFNRNELKAFYCLIVHYWANYKYFITKQNIFNLWCELNELCHEMDDSFPDPHDDHKAVVSFCKAHPYYFIDMLPPKLVQKLFCQYYDDRLDVLAAVAQKLHTEGLRAACACANEALGLDEDIDELVRQSEEHIKAFS